MEGSSDTAPVCRDLGVWPRQTTAISFRQRFMNLLKMDFKKTDSYDGLMDIDLPIILGVVF